MASATAVVTRGSVVGQQHGPPAQDRAPPNSAVSPQTRNYDEEYLANLYYIHFHPAHPILLPRSRYNTDAYPPFLRLVIQLIGSQYAPNVPSDAFRDAVDTALMNVSERSISLVQALLLYAITLHARAERVKAVNILAKAVDLGIGVGMYRIDFASTHGMQDSLIEESLRRTWWELYVVDGFFAALHRQSNFRCNAVELGAFLPSDDEMYLQGIVDSQFASLSQFDSRFFADDDPSFSSACYRVEAVRILGRVIALANSGEDQREKIQTVDNAIAAWKYHLPDTRAGIINRSGEVDQMMFQAHTFIDVASILLHFPRSELPFMLPAAAELACGERMFQGSPALSQSTVKALSGSQEISDLVTLPLDTMSPLFACGLVLGSIVQLSACSAHPNNCSSQHRDRVLLMTGGLKAMGRNWPISRDNLRELNKIANAIFNPRQEIGSMTTPSSLDSGIDMEMLQNMQNISWFDLFYAGDMNDQYTSNQDLWDVQ